MILSSLCVRKDGLNHIRYFEVNPKYYEEILIKLDTMFLLLGLSEENSSYTLIIKPEWITEVFNPAQHRVAKFGLSCEFKYPVNPYTFVRSSGKYYRFTKLNPSDLTVNTEVRYL